MAHRRADHEKFNISEKTQRRHLIKLLETEIAKLAADETIDAEPAAEDRARVRISSVVATLDGRAATVAAQNGTKDRRRSLIRNALVSS